MNRRRIVLIVSAVVLALIGTGVVYSYINSADQRALNGVKAVSVLVASKPIPAGTAWSSIGQYTSTQSFPESSVPTSSLKSTSAAVGGSKVTTFAVSTGQVLTSEMFAATAAPATGSLQIPGDRQALTIALTPKADVGGYVNPGSDVAVYTGLAQTTLLIERLRVLAVSQAPLVGLTGPGATSPSQESLMVTLAVTQQQAQQLVTAQNHGGLYLALLTSTSTPLSAK